jgi:Holliday junction DNA helicase RuvB
MGLNLLDTRFLNVIIDFYKGGPAGLEAISATMQEEPDTLIDMVEPFLLKAGFLVRTSSGRKATEFAYRHLKKMVMKAPSGQMKLPEF